MGLAIVALALGILALGCGMTLFFERRAQEQALAFIPNTPTQFPTATGTPTVTHTPTHTATPVPPTPTLPVPPSAFHARDTVLLDQERRKRRRRARP